jgi:hypothetical protein
MCNGDSANGTVESCNGYGGASCATDWLERNGDSGRILVRVFGCRDDDERLTD